LPLIEGLIIPFCRLTTPNLREAGYFLDREISTAIEAEEAAPRTRLALEYGVLLKAGI